MKQFPRIHSLATLGIRQHQNFDYNFHGFRTDFIGDSGSGKSMIADLLQIVFTGSEAFHSGTDGLEKRDAEGMILKTAGNGTDMAYVLVNVEIDNNQFLVIGAYLETISKHTKSFVLQRSFSEEELIALNNPISFLDLLVNDEIPTLDMLKKNQEDKGVIYHGFNQRKKFHAYLFRHRILNIDLSSNQQILKDYAAIVQSFSRGKSLDVGNSDSLKNFIFGQEKAKEIVEKYKKAVDELHSSLKEFAVNRQELDTATLKYNAIQDLRLLESEFQSAKDDWFIKQCAYLHQEAEDALRSLKDSCEQHITNVLSVRALQEMIRQELVREQEQTFLFQEKVLTAKASYDKVSIKYQKVRPVHALLERLKICKEELLIRYQRYHEYRDRKALIERVTNELHLKSLYQSALMLSGETDGKVIIEKLQTEIDFLNAEYEHKSSFVKFVSGSDKKSFGYWFTENYAPQSKVLESIIIFYKTLPVEIPSDNSSQYIHSPAEFLKDAKIVDEDDAGFWLSNGEVRQYIKLVEKPLFTSDEASTFQALLLQVGSELDKEIAEIEKRVNQKKKLKSFVINSSEFLSFLQYQAETDQSGILTFEEEPEFDIDAKDLDAGIALIDHFEEINSDHQIASEVWNDEKDAANNYKHFIESIKETNTQLTVKAGGQSSSKMLETITDLFPQMELTEQEIQRQIDYYGVQYQKANVKEKWFTNTAGGALQSLKYSDLNAVITEYNQLLKNKDDIFREARLELFKEPDISPYELVRLEEPRTERESYGIAKGVYERKFEEIARIYAPGDAYKFQNSFNFIELTLAVLPDAFLSEEAKEENFITQIEKYFSQINEKNKTLNSRKLHRIKEILDDVDDEIEKRLDTVRKIHLFLNAEDQEITGGHRVSLRAEEILGYPRKWIQDYIDKLEQEDTLFTTGQTLDELLKDSTSLQEKMIAAFHYFGGHKTMKATVETLLNPNSYFKLNFAMESHSTGKNNKGSTGQVYAAIALLCIARLSLVNKAGFNKDLTPGIRFMPIDEAEGLGSNFDMLHDIARKFDYQIVTMSIGPLGRFSQGEQYIYILSNNKSAGNEVNHPPMGIFSDKDRDDSPLAEL
jgi:hypothetical protein